MSEYLLRVDAGSAIDGLLRAKREIRKEFERANFDLLRELLRRARAQVPRKTGELSRSGVVEQRATAEGPQGAVLFLARYAMPVHEIPPPVGGGRSAQVRRDRRAKGNRRTAFHPRGKWKYLEDPYKEMAPSWDKVVAERVATVIARIRSRE